MELRQLLGLPTRGAALHRTNSTDVRYRFQARARDFPHPSTIAAAPPHRTRAPDQPATTVQAELVRDEYEMTDDISQLASASPRSSQGARKAEVAIDVQRGGPCGPPLFLLDRQAVSERSGRVAGARDRVRRARVQDQGQGQDPRHRSRWPAARSQPGWSGRAYGSLRKSLRRWPQAQGSALG